MLCHSLKFLRHNSDCNKQYIKLTLGYVFKKWSGNIVTKWPKGYRVTWTTEKPVLKDHSHDRPLSSRATYSWQKVLHFNTNEPFTRDHLSWETIVFMVKGVVFQDRFHCIHILPGPGAAGSTTLTAGWPVLPLSQLTRFWTRHQACSTLRWPDSLALIPGLHCIWIKTNE